MLLTLPHARYSPQKQPKMADDRVREGWQVIRQRLGGSPRGPSSFQSFRRENLKGNHGSFTAFKDESAVGRGDGAGIWLVKVIVTRVSCSAMTDACKEIADLE
jgi:hypothetical protein